MIAEVLEKPEVEYEQDESHATLYVNLKEPGGEKEMTGVYHFSPLETEEPGFEQGQTVELWGDLDRDEGYFEISGYAIRDTQAAG